MAGSQDGVTGASKSGSGLLANLPSYGKDNLTDLGSGPLVRHDALQLCLFLFQTHASLPMLVCVRVCVSCTVR